MTIIVEDGTGLSTAESYVSLAAFKTWAINRGHALDAKTDASIEAALRRATGYIDATYGGAFTGDRLMGRAQALLWPRSDATDARGEDVDADEVPIEVVNGTCEAALRELTAGLLPDIKAGGGVTRRVKAGSVEVEFANDGNVQKRFPAIDAALAGLIGTSSSYGFAVASPAATPSILDLLDVIE